MARRNTSTPEVAFARSWVQVDEWDDLTKGDTVIIKGERGEFRFMYAYSQNDQITGVTVVGDGGYRTFVPSRVGKPKAKRTRKVSLPKE